MSETVPQVRGIFVMLHSGGGVELIYRVDEIPAILETLTKAMDASAGTIYFKDGTGKEAWIKAVALVGWCVADLRENVQAEILTILKKQIERPVDGDEWKG